MRRRHIAIVAATVCGLLAPSLSAHADPPPGNTRGQQIYGNVVGDPTPDRITLGSDSAACTATVEQGLGGGYYGTPVVHEYTIAGLTDPATCPNMGTAVHRHASVVDDLAVTWFSPPHGADGVYVLRNFAALSRTAASLFPSLIGSADFNGDGNGDVWESSDQDEQFTSYLRHGSGFVPGRVSFTTIAAAPSLAFGQLDNTGGTDVAASYESPTQDQPGLPGSKGSGVLVIFGRTGAKVLLDHTSSFTPVAYTVALIDYNNDGNLDVQVSGGTSQPRIWLGDGQGHFHLALQPA